MFTLEVLAQLTVVCRVVLIVLRIDRGAGLNALRFKPLTLVKTKKLPRSRCLSVFTTQHAGGGAWRLVVSYNLGSQYSKQPRALHLYLDPERRETLGAMPFV